MKPQVSTSERPSVRSLARKTGLSVATISRVLNNSGNVAEATRRSVEKAIREEGYVPNSAARALSTRRTHTIGAVLPTLSSSIFAKFTEALEFELARRGYCLVIATTQYNADLEAVRVRALLDIGVEGLVLSGAGQTDDLLTLLEQTAIPAVCSSIHKTNNGLTAIGYDNAQMGSKAIDYLHSLGHTRIAIVHGPKQGNDRTQLRLKGVKRAVKKLGITAGYYETSLDVSGGVDVAKLLIADRSATAALCLSDVIAQGLLFECARVNLPIPAKLSLMGFDDLDWTGVCYPSLTTVSLPAQAMGVSIAETLTQYLDNAVPMKPVTIPARIVERDSTRVLAP